MSVPKFYLDANKVVAHFDGKGCLLLDEHNTLWWFDAEKKTVFKVGEDPDAAAPVETCSYAPTDDEIPF